MNIFVQHLKLGFENRGTLSTNTKKMENDYELPTIKTAAIDFSRFQVVQGNRGSARGDILDRFLEKLNPSREAAGYKPLTHARISVMLAHIQTDDLFSFYRQCETAGIPFSAYFHWSLKPKK